MKNPISAPIIKNALNDLEIKNCPLKYFDTYVPLVFITKWPVRIVEEHLISLYS